MWTTYGVRLKTMVFFITVAGLSKVQGHLAEPADPGRGGLAVASLVSQHSGLVAAKMQLGRAPLSPFTSASSPSSLSSSSTENNLSRRVAGRRVMEKFISSSSSSSATSLVSISSYSISGTSSTIARRL